jgi:hypothetical protein
MRFFPMGLFFRALKPPMGVRLCLVHERFKKVEIYIVGRARFKS